MSAKSISCIVLLSAFMLSIGGCVAVLVGTGAAAGVGYVKGDLEAVLEDDIDTVYDASLKAVKELELAVISKEKNALDARIISRTSTDKKINITLKRTDEDLTKLSIRIGTFGDETQSRTIYDKIKRNL